MSSKVLIEIDIDIVYFKFFLIAVDSATSERRIA